VAESGCILYHKGGEFYHPLVLSDLALLIRMLFGSVCQYHIG